MDKRSIEDRIREDARQQFAENVKGAIQIVTRLIHNTSPMKQVVERSGKDLTDKRLLEILQQHIIDTQSLQHEENAIDEFFHRTESFIEQNSELFQSD